MFEPLVTGRQYSYRNIVRSYSAPSHTYPLPCDTCYTYYLVHFSTWTNAVYGYM